MRFAFRRSALFAAASLIALGMAAPSLGQEAPSAEIAPLQAEPAVEAEPSLEPDATAPDAESPDAEGQDPEIIIADEPATP
ncbi:MAG: hypothetical protein RSG56_04880, partial [Brevundimonas sp.]